MYETHDEYKARLDEMVRTGKLKIQYRDILLELDELLEEAHSLKLIQGYGWGEDANHNVIDEYEILDNQGNFLYLTLADTRSRVQNLIKRRNHCSH
ncbi:MAG: hypothetical protein DSM106950_42795 [Stigonema ocellatum SAG 48.90 = DSM 106950]|nr:hypothetical protein [Stigonema ocellatum SAG 48.90 = DSM 106950]